MFLYYLFSCTLLLISPTYFSRQRSEKVFKSTRPMRDEVYVILNSFTERISYSIRRIFYHMYCEQCRVLQQLLAPFTDCHDNPSTDTAPDFATRSLSNIQLVCVRACVHVCLCGCVCGCVDMDVWIYVCMLMFPSRIVYM